MFLGLAKMTAAQQEEVKAACKLFPNVSITSRMFVEEIVKDFDDDDEDEDKSTAADVTIKDTAGMNIGLFYALCSYLLYYNYLFHCILFYSHMLHIHVVLFYFTLFLILSS